MSGEAPSPRRPGTDPPLGSAQPPCRHEDQRHGDVSRGIRQHPRRVRHEHPPLATGGDVDVVVPDGHVRDDAKPRPRGIQHLSVHPVDEHRDQSVDPGQGGQELVPGHRGVDVAEDDVVAGLAKARHGIPHDLSGDENAPHGHMIFRTSGRGR